MKEFLVVDGYNIIFAWPEFEKFKDTDLAHARCGLVSILANHSPLTGQKIYVVFDAHRVSGFTERTEIIDGIEVIYTQMGETADTYIESMVGKLLKKGIVYVATSDWAEQGIIFGRGAYRITPGELRTHIKDTKRESGERYQGSLPADAYLENRLLDNVRSKLEKLRRGKK